MLLITSLPRIKCYFLVFGFGFVLFLRFSIKRSSLVKDFIFFVYFYYFLFIFVGPRNKGGTALSK